MVSIGLTVEYLSLCYFIYMIIYQSYILREFKQRTNRNMPLIKNVQTSDGRKLSATFYDSKLDVKGAVLIVPAMGTQQKYYADFATWLASQGYVCATFDYFGMGASQRGDLADLDISITDWAQYDCSAMIDAIKEEAPDQTLYWLGHSLGGQILGITPNHTDVNQIITIAAGSGYWLENAPALKWRAWWLWFFVVPVALKIYGYFPGKRLRKVGDLPGGVMRQWRKWCLNKHYLFGVENKEVKEKYEAIETSITSISFTDDELMSKKNIESLHGFYSSSNKKMIRITPKSIGVERIGHFGFFKPRFKESLWESQLLPVLRN